jgi:hypothetical protein
MPEKLIVQLPNLVASFLAETFDVNENYAAVSQVSREWLGEKCGLGARDKRILQKGDFVYSCALNTPDCGPDKFRDFCDWVNWVFPFDDIFDNGELKDDPKGAKAVLDNLLDSMHGTAEPKTKFVAAHQDVWTRFKEVGTCSARIVERLLMLSQKAPRGNCRRFIQALTVCATDVLRQVQDCSIEQVQKPEDLIKLRRNSIGVKPLYAFVEYGHNIELPDYVIQHPLIQEIELLGIDWVLIQNDLISYPKDEEEGVNHNLISSRRLNGMRAQEAYDHLGSMLEGIYQRFDESWTSFPTGVRRSMPKLSGTLRASRTASRRICTGAFVQTATSDTTESM